MRHGVGASQGAAVWGMAEARVEGAVRSHPDWGQPGAGLGKGAAGG